MTAKAFEVNCKDGPNVEETITQMQSEGYRFAQLVMPTGTYGWLVGVRDNPPFAPPGSHEARRVEREGKK